MESRIVPFPSSGRVKYSVVLDWATLGRVTADFRKLHPELLPIVLYRVLDDVWYGDLDAEQVKQALRDCYDMVEAALSRGGLYAPAAYLRSRLALCLENQCLGLAPPPGSPEAPAIAPPGGPSLSVVPSLRPTDG